MLCYLAAVMLTFSDSISHLLKVKVTRVLSEWDRRQSEGKVKGHEWLRTVKIQCEGHSGLGHVHFLSGERTVVFCIKW